MGDTIKSSDKSSICGEMPYVLPENVKSYASLIFSANVHAIKRMTNRKNIIFTCICAAYASIYPNVYDPFYIADIMCIDHTSMGRAFKSHPLIYKEYKHKLSSVSPMNIIRSRINQFNIKNGDDLLKLTNNIVETHQNDVYFSNSSSPLGVAGGLFIYYCELHNMLTSKLKTEISKIFTISEQILEKNLGFIRIVDNKIT